MEAKVLYIRVNKHCNARCFMCDFWKKPKLEITETQFDYLQTQLGNVKLVRFTGGEPLLHKKLPEFIRTLHELGIVTSVITNGLLLSEKLDELVECGLDQIVFSVDGALPEIHNQIRGVNGLLEKIEKSLILIDRKYPELHTRVNTVVSDRNLEHLSSLAEWLESYHVEQWSIIPIKMTGYDWKSKISLNDFKKYYEHFQKTIKKCSVKMMGYSASWAGIPEDFWNGKNHMRPLENCNLVKIMSFYDPFLNHFYPCNCIPHRKKGFFSNQEDEREWYFEHGHEYCKGCDPLNAYCSDYPSSLEYNILNI